MVVDAERVCLGRDGERMNRLRHGMLLDAKSVMDDAMPDLEMLRELIPPVLHERYEKIVRRFEDTLCDADVSDQYEEKRDRR